MNLTFILPPQAKPCKKHTQLCSLCINPQALETSREHLQRDPHAQRGGGGGGDLQRSPASPPHAKASVKLVGPPKLELAG